MRRQSIFTYSSIWDKSPRICMLKKISLCSFHLFFIYLFCLFVLFCLFSPSYCISVFFFHFIHIPSSSLLLVFYFLFFLFRLYISYHINVIPNPTQHPSLVPIHFAIFLSFINVVVNFIFSHTTSSFYPLLYFSSI